MSALVAILDDHDSFLEMMRDLLEDEGYRVSLRNTSPGALEWIRRDRPSVVILDLVMEEHDSGLNVLRRLGGDADLRPIPVLVCSANSHFLVEHRAELEERAAAVLPKPFNLDEMLRLVADLVGQGEKSPRK